MALSPARLAAYEVLLAVDEKGSYVSELLHSSRYQKLSAIDHGLATELAMGALRWRSWLDEQIAKQASIKLNRLDFEVLIALRLAAYQLAFLQRVPQRAAVHESVELVKHARKRSAVPFVNAVLRKLAESALEAPMLDGTSVEKLASSSAHPSWLVERWVAEYGIEAAKQICKYDQMVPETSLHVPERLRAQTEGANLKPGLILASARRAEGNGKDLNALLDSGASILGEGSQLVARLLGNGDKFLDCCAAPGGKTRLLAESNPSASVIAAELHPHRARVLRKLVTASNVHVITADARALPTETQFDRILVDVPCSGTGTLARNPEIKWKLSQDDLADLQQRQVAILRGAMARLAVGGRLVYSSCSLEPEENQSVVEAALANQSEFRFIDVRTRLEELRASGELVWHNLDSMLTGPYLRTIPGVHPCDGFFAATIDRN